MVGTSEYSGAHDVLHVTNFGLDEFHRLRQIVQSAQTSELHQEVRQMQTDENLTPAETVALGAANYLLARHEAAVRLLSEVSGNGLADFIAAESYESLERHAEAEEKFASAAASGYDAVQCDLGRAGAVRGQGRLDEAEKILQATGREGATRAEYSYQRGCILSDRGDTFGAIEYFERAVDMDSHHTKALFRLASLHALIGNDEEAIRLYEQCLSKPPYYMGALINLGLLYEDRENYTAAAFCFRRVLEADPRNQRARLYMKDIDATSDMYYDEEELRRQSELEHLMRIPITDFELSARARNCLERAGIDTIGDLTKVSEQELLSGKNFGETSLREIADLVVSKGLRIGQFVEDSRSVSKPYQPEALSPQERVQLEAPVTDLNLSVRSRKCLSKLGINTLGELVSRSPDDLLGIRNFGVTSLNEIREKLTERGMKLRAD